MAKLATVTFTCERALRMVGAYAITDSGAQAHEMEEARYWLDMIVGTLAGVEECTWLITDELSIALSGGVAKYNIKSALGSNYPTDGLQFAVDAVIENQNGHRHDLELVSKSDFENRCKLDQTGCPEIAYIDRTEDPVLRVWPVLGVDQNSYSIKISFQKHSPDISSSKTTAVGFRRAWNEWAVHKLAARIGNGPVRRVSTNEISLNLRIAEALEEDLINYENAEKTTTAPIVQPYGY